MNTNSLLEYGMTNVNAQGGENIVLSIISPRADDNVHMRDSAGRDRTSTPSEIFGFASDFVKDCDSLVLARYGDSNCLPYLNVRLTFMKYAADRAGSAAVAYLDRNFPWDIVAQLLTSLVHVRHQSFSLQALIFVTDIATRATSKTLIASRQTSFPAVNKVVLSQKTGL